MPTFEVLRSATINAAEATEKPSEFGTIEVGNRADLLPLEHNPLDGVVNLRKPAGVMVRGTGSIEPRSTRC